MTSRLLRKRRLWCVALAAFLLLAGCSSSTTTLATDASTRCVPGESSMCAGQGGCAGDQVCRADGEGYEACECESPSGDSSARDASVDARMRDGDVGDRPASDAGRDEVSDSASVDAALNETGFVDGSSIDTSLGDAGPGDSASFDTGSVDGALNEAGTHEGGFVDGASTDTGLYDVSPSDAEAGDSSSVDGANDSALGDAATNVTCTFTTSNSTDPGCANPTCILPAPSTVTQSNISVYLDDKCSVPNSQSAATTYGVVIDAPNVWMSWEDPSDSFCLTASTSSPGELVAQPAEIITNGAFTGEVTIDGSQAIVALSGSRTPGVAGCTEVHGCVTQTISCSGTAVALLSNCATNNGGCDSNATCTWTGPTTNTCACSAGYSGDGGTCTVIDPCLSNNGGCDPNATCFSSGPGQAVCMCNTGYLGDGTTCDPI